MSHGKEAARDLRYGRRGGRWASGESVDVALAAIDKMRTKGLADGTWPDGTPKGDRECSACRRPLADHSPPCPWCGRAPEHHAPGDVDAEIAGRVRMARGREAAGVLLDHGDRMALKAAA